MAKPPSSPPSSDLKKVDRDGSTLRPSTSQAAEGEEGARKESKGRPADAKR